MTIEISAEDPRSIKAIEIAAGAGQWLKCHTADGRKAYGVPSQCSPGRYYLVTLDSCDCQDAQRHTTQACKHQLAVRLHCELAKAHPRPKTRRAVLVRRSASQPRSRTTDTEGPVLDMVREADGSIRWERHEHADGSATYLPRSGDVTTDNDAAFWRRFED